MHSNMIKALTFRTSINFFNGHVNDCKQGICLLYVFCFFVCLFFVVVFFCCFFFVFFLLFFFCNFGLRFHCFLLIRC